MLAFNHLFPLAFTLTLESFSALCVASMVVTNDFDAKTGEFVQQLHRVWRNNGTISTYAKIRDSLLAQQEEIGTHIIALVTVAQIACSAFQGGADEVDPKWDELFALAAKLEVNDNDDGDSDGRERKRSCNARCRVRNLTVIAALWSPEVVWHYGWNNAGQGQMKLTKACAVEYPHFGQDFLPRLNAALLHRHREAVISGRGKSLAEAPLQPHRDCNLYMLADVSIDSTEETWWASNIDGTIPIDEEGKLLRDLRPYHFQLYLLQKDWYGMLISRQTANTLQTTTTVIPMTATAGSTTETACTPTAWPLETDNLRHIQSTSIDSELERSTLSSIPLDHQLSCTQPSAMSNLSPGHDLFMDLCRFTIQSEWMPLDTVDPHANSVGDVDDTQCAVPNKRLDIAELGTGAGTYNPFSQRLALTDPVPLEHDDMTIEGTLHAKHRQVLNAYMQRLVEEANGAGEVEQRRTRAAWLNGTTQWANIWTPADRSLPPCRALDEEDADVLYYSSDDLVMEAQRGKVFRRPVVVKESIADAGMHTAQGLVALMRDASHNTTLADRRLEHKQSEAVAVDKSFGFDSSLRTSGSEIHVFNLRNITKAHRPLLSLLNRFRLLESLADRVVNKQDDQTETSPVDVSNRIGFNVLGLPGAFSGAHINSLGGGWVRNLQGISFWMIVPEREMDSVWTTLTETRERWEPKGKQCLIVLEEDDVLFIPSGVLVVHAVHSPTRCLMECGTLWDDLNVIETLRAIHRVCKNPKTSREAIPYQLPYVVAELEDVVMADVRRFCGDNSTDDFISAFGDAVTALKDLGCRCLTPDCNASCVCKQEGRRCTSWCSGHLTPQSTSC